MVPTPTGQLGGRLFAVWNVGNRYGIKRAAARALHAATRLGRTDFDSRLGP